MGIDNQNRMEKMGQNLSGWLSKKENGITKGMKKILLFVMVILVGSYCLFLVAGNGSKMILGNSISFPKIGVTESKKVLEQRVKQLSSYLDSLKNSPSGRHEYDSLLIAHPFIYDSIALWKQKMEQLPGK